MGTDTGDAAMELEGMRKEDSSWQPCRVSLSSSGFDLIIDFGSQYLEEIISNEEEVLARLRIRSVPLLSGDCLLIEEGERVLATHKSQFKTLFFDAMVDKALRVRHSKRISCRCTFEVKWLLQDLKGATSIVPSTSIMKLATQSISVHPTVAAFLKSLKTLRFSAAPCFSAVLEDVDGEVDLHNLLEKQIEEISNLADASKKETSEVTSVGVKADVKEQMDSCPIVQSKITSLPFQAPLEPENHKSPHSSCNLQVELEVKDPLPLDSSIQEELSENRTYLSPLASRAALASIMSKLPQKLEFSIHREEENGFNFAPDNSTDMHVNMDLSNGTKPVKNKLSSEIEAAFVPDEIFRSFATAEMDASRRPLLPETSFEIANPNSQDDACPILSGMVEERELRRPAKASGFTCLAIQKDAASSTSNAEMKAYAEGIKLGTLTNRRLTRSAVLRQEENLAMELKERLEVNNLGQCMESNSSEGNVTIPDEKVPKKKTPISSPPAQTISPVTEDRNKKRKMPDVVKTTSKAEGKVSWSDGNGESQKRKSVSSKKQELRFSPRLRFLPRTRSANKGAL